MQLFPTTVVLRHRRENLKKCSLRGLEPREDFKFYTYPQDTVPPLENYIMLCLDAPPLTRDDAPYGLFILDSTWRYAETMMRQVKGEMIQRSLPPEWRTAYPRRQDDCSDPERGLASVEAIFIAYQILGRDTSGLLDNYYWKDLFYDKNKSLIKN